jgi:hypothetical protein
MLLAPPLNKAGLFFMAQSVSELAIARLSQLGDWLLRPS